jgi:hypothetical protein
VRAYEAALALKPDNEDIQLRMAFLLIKAKQPDKAVPVLQALADKGTKAYDVYTTLARIAYERTTRGERGRVRQGAGRPRRRKTWFNLGVVRVRRNDLRGRLDAFERAGVSTRRPRSRPRGDREGQGGPAEIDPAWIRTRGSEARPRAPPRRLVAFGERSRSRA